MAGSYLYTLLIVESESIASIIRKLNIPYLEVIATNGFCWRPFYNWESKKMEMRAIPEKLDIRKLLKSKAPWSARIIIASDTDSAGEFIAYSVHKFLKRHHPLRGYINGLTSHAITQTTKRAKPYSFQPYSEMSNRFIIHQLVRKSFGIRFGKNAWTKLIIIRLFESNLEFTHFRSYDSPGVHIKSSKPFDVHFNSKHVIKLVSENRPDYQIVQAWNTANVLEIMNKRGITVKKAQDTLNRLFTTLPENLGFSTISYPRTTEKAYYKSTWESEYENWIRHNDTETFVPRLLWDISSGLTPHEAIHPTNTNLGPSDIRPFFRKDLYDLYSMIYEHHKKVIKKPDLIKRNMFILSDIRQDNLEFHGDNTNKISEKMTIYPVMKLSDFLGHLVDYGSVRPSGFGKTIFELLSEKWLSLDDGIVGPGEAYKRAVQSIRSIKTIADLTETLKGMIYNTDWKKSELFNELSRISNTDFI